MKNILLLGGTGFIGSHICEKLARLQVRVTVPTRRYEAARNIIPLPLVTVLESNIHDEATLTRLLDGHDAAINLVGELHGSEAQLNRAHAELPQKLARACTAAGVRRMVHLSAVGAGMEAPSRYLRSKARGETAVRESGLAATILRPSVVFGAEDSFINMFARLQRVFPVLPLAGSGAKFQPVWVEDLADAVIACLKNDDTIGHTYEICGPDVFTLKQLVQMAGQYAGVNGGRGRPIIGLPHP
ncbi:MAG: complex I NDUFA9 subunit family protein, partial [Bdellovibrionales bacterium]|nr:complex I NDUFA9 subunit family protein [Ramlibacter sp.]